MKLYVNPASSNCRKVLAVSRFVDDGAEAVLVDLAKGEQRKPEFLALNPNGKVPVLEDGDTVLWESNAIMGYQCTRANSEKLWPKSGARYDILRWQFWELAHFGPACAKLVWENMLKGMLGQGPADPDAVRHGLEDFATHATVLNSHLEGRDYLVGGHVTIADFSVGSTLTYASPAQIPLADFPNIQAYLARLDEIPAWRETAPVLG